MDSLLIGFYTLLLYSYSQRHTHLTLGSGKRDIGAPMLLTGRAENREIFFLFLFSGIFESTVSSKPTACLPNASVRLRTRVCVCCAEAGDA